MHLRVLQSSLPRGGSLHRQLAKQPLGGTRELLDASDAARASADVAQAAQLPVAMIAAMIAAWLDLRRRSATATANNRELNAALS